MPTKHEAKPKKVLYWHQGSMPSALFYAQQELGHGVTVLKNLPMNTQLRPTHFNVLAVHQLVDLK